MDITELRHKYRDQILLLASKYNAENVRVFGSVARNENFSESDIDILVHFKKGASLLDEAGLDYELNKLVGKKVDLVADDAIRDEFVPFILESSIPL